MDFSDFIHFPPRSLESIKRKAENQSVHCLGNLKKFFAPEFYFSNYQECLISEKQTNRKDNINVCKLFSLFFRHF